MAFYDQGKYIGEQLYLFETSEKNLSLEDVLNSKFNRSRYSVPSFGYSDKDLWIKFKFHHDNIESFLLEINNIAIDEIEVYVVEHSKPIIQGIMGDKFPFNKREYFHRNFVFKISIDKEYLLKITSRSSLKIPIRLWSDQGFVKHVVSEYTVFSLYYGIIFCLALLSLIFAINTRRYSFLIYFFYVISFIILHLSLDGFAYQFFWPNSPDFKKIANILALIIFSILMIIYSRKYLEEVHDIESKRMSRYFYFFVNTGVLIWGALLLIMPLFSYQELVKIALTLNFLTVLFLMSVSLIAIYNKVDKVIYLFIGIFADFIGMLIYFLKSLSFIEYSFFSEHSTEIMYLIQYFSFLIGTSIYIKESEISAKSFRNIMGTISYVIHELKRPFSIIRDFLLEIEDKVDTKSMSMIEYKFQSAENMSKRILNSLSAYDSNQISKEIKTSHSIIDLIQSATNDIKVTYRYDKNVEIRYEISHEHMAFVHGKSIVTAFTNIIENALEATMGNTNILVSTRESSARLIIRFSNTNSAVDEKYIKKLFDKGFTTKKTGHGYGLYIVKSIVMENNGAIRASSTENEFNLEIELPKSKDICEKSIDVLPNTIKSTSSAAIHRSVLNEKVIIKSGLREIRILIYSKSCKFISNAEKKINSISDKISASSVIKVDLSVNYKADIILIDDTFIDDISMILSCIDGVSEAYLMSDRECISMPPNINGFIQKPLSKFEIIDCINNWMSRNLKSQYEFVFLDDRDEDPIKLLSAFKGLNIAPSYKIFSDIDRLLSYVEEDKGKNIDLIFIDRFIFGKDMVKMKVPDSLRFLDYKEKIILWSFAESADRAFGFDAFISKDRDMIVTAEEIRRGLLC